jgi:hypothetical protein
MKAVIALEIVFRWVRITEVFHLHNGQIILDFATAVKVSVMDADNKNGDQ